MSTTTLADRFALMGTALAPLRQRLDGWQRAFDARPPRERLLMIAVATALALAAVDTLWLSPAFAHLKAARQRQHEAQTIRQQLQTDVLAIGNTRDAQARLKQAEVAAWRQRAREGESLLRTHEDTLISPEQMMALVEQVLARHGQVRVRSMRLLERVDLLAGNGGAAAGQPAAPGAAPGVGATRTAGSASSPGMAPAQPGAPAAPAAPGGLSLYRHGVELQLEGSFGDLLAYLQALEAMPQHLLWGAMQMQVQQHPQVLLTLRVYTISRERHGLEL